MCGIAGVVRGGSAGGSLGAPGLREDERRLERCMARLARRGPDGRGAWRSEDGAVTLAHARLAIQDLSDRAAQPMRSADRSVTLVYNGEVYNARALRTELEREGARFTTTSDTEVLLESLRVRGVERTLDTVRGMFAFVAVIEARDGSRTLHAAVDPAGMKPLVWVFDGHGADENARACGPAFMFASDADALRELMPKRPAPDPVALGHVLCNGVCPTPRTMWKGVRALGAGERLEWRIGDERPPRIVRYWQPPETLAETVCGERDQKEFDDLFTQLCAEHMIGDVPVGMFLSAGLDSSAVALALRRAGADMSRITAYTLSTGHDDEAREAAGLARMLGMPHEVVRFGDGELEPLVREAAAAFDAPQGYSALLTATRIARAMREHGRGRGAKVALTGDGGDECFAGYSWHRADHEHPLSLASMRAVKGGERAEHDRLAARLGAPGIDPRERSAAGLALGSLSYPHRHARRLFSGFHPTEACALMPELIGRDGFTVEDFAGWLAPHDRAGLPHPRRAQRTDLMGFCAQSIQPKLDRACMSVGLELRAPFLDRRMLEWSLGRAVREEKESKPLVREFLRRGVRDGLVPESVLSRPKQGFSLRLGGGEPFSALRPMVDDSALVRDGVLRRDYAEFLPREAEAREVRWCLLGMLAAWHEERR